MANLVLALWKLHLKTIGLEAKYLRALDSQFTESEHEVQHGTKPDTGAQERETKIKTKVI